MSLRSYQAEDIAQTGVVMQGSLPGSGGHFHLKNCILVPAPMTLAMPLICLPPSCGTHGAPEALSSVKVFGVITQVLLTFLPVSCRVLELVAPIIAFP